MDHNLPQLLKKAPINYKGLSPFLIFFVLILLLIFYFESKSIVQNKPLKVGILFSQTGVMAVTEKPILRATLLAIDEINHKGGIKGVQIEPVIYDPASNLKHTAELAEKMIEEDKVVVIFGCFTSACRKEVKEVIEKFDNLLIYPVDYEGVEESKHIIYLGMTPNQKLIPAVAWVLEKKIKKIYLAGSDYIWARVVNEIIANEIRMMGGEVVGTQYVLLGSTNVDFIIDDIILKKPEYIFSTLIGPTISAFLPRIYEKIPKSQMPSIMAFGFIPFENKNDKKKYAGLHFVESYYRELNNPENRAFLKAYENKYGSSNEVDYPAATSYTGVYLWAQAVRESPTTDPLRVREYILRQSIASPAGVMYVDPVNANTWRSVFIERIDQQGGREVVWTSNVPIQPITYPEYKTKAEWDLFEYQLYIGWGNAWEKT